MRKGRSESRNNVKSLLPTWPALQILIQCHKLLDLLGLTFKSHRNSCNFQSLYPGEEEEFVCQLTLPSGGSSPCGKTTPTFVSCMSVALSRSYPVPYFSSFKMEGAGHKTRGI